MKYEQLSLFVFPNEPQIKIIHDPYWDEPSAKDIAHQHNTCVGEQLLDADSTCKSVGEQVISDTLKVAPQHDGKLYTQLSSENSTHWIEKYWVERGTNKYWYYRYTWMEKRKLHRVYIGSVTSNKAQMKKQVVESAILDGQPEQEIIALMRKYVWDTNLRTSRF